MHQWLGLAATAGLGLQLCSAAAASRPSTAGLTVEPAGGPTVDVEGAVSVAKACCGVASPHTCPGHVPDIPARCFLGADHRVQMIVGSTSYFPMSGPSPLNQSRSCSCAYNKTGDGDPSHFAADEYEKSPRTNNQLIILISYR